MQVRSLAHNFSAVVVSVIVLALYALHYIVATRGSVASGVRKNLKTYLQVGEYNELEPA